MKVDFISGSRRQLASHGDRCHVEYCVASQARDSRQGRDAIPALPDLTQLNESDRFVFFPESPSCKRVVSTANADNG
jgi:hypothetical protein